ncbi:MAG: hypothetical protein QOJ60_2999 [Actinomycetota bacterium]|nr:hypothetical protein [Actinomycetota bacterium]
MEQWRIETPQSLDLEGVRRLNVRMVSGSVDVVGRTEDAESGAAHIEVSEVDGPLQINLDGDTLTITHEKLTWGGLLDWTGRKRASAVVSVSVPASCPVELGVVSADAVVSGIDSPTKVKSVSGDVTLDGVRADISAQTVSGDLESRELAGVLKFTTVSGELTVVDGRSDRVKAETVSGDIILDLDLLPDASIDLNSVSGDVTLRFADHVGLKVEVNTMSGDLESAFGGVSSNRKPGRATMKGEIGDGSGRLRANTVSGDVVLLRREPA